MRQTSPEGRARFRFAGAGLQPTAYIVHDNNNTEKETRARKKEQVGETYLANHAGLAKIAIQRKRTHHAVESRIIAGVCDSGDVICSGLL